MAYRRSYRSTRRRNSSFRRGFTPARRQIWVRQTLSSGVVTSPPVYAGDLLNVSDLDPGARVGSTVIRIIGGIEVTSTAPINTPLGGFYVGVAVMPAFNDAFTPPIKPFEDQNSADWMFWNYFAISSLAQVNSAVVDAVNTFWLPLDVKSKRVIGQPKENLYVVIETISLAGVTGFNFHTSTLLRLA